MLYLLGGASRSGKSVIADKLIKREIPFFSTDFLMMGLEKGLPEFGIHHNQSSSEIAVKIWPILQGIATTLIDINQDYLIEGDALSPELVKKLIDEKGIDKVRICFIGYKEISPEEKIKHITDFPSNKNNWIDEKSDEFIVEFMQKEIDRSKALATRCDELGIRYIDMSSNFNESVNEVVNYFTNSQERPEKY